MRHLDIICVILMYYIVYIKQTKNQNIENTKRSPAIIFLEECIILSHAIRKIEANTQKMQFTKNIDLAVLKKDGKKDLKFINSSAVKMSIPFAAIM